MAITISKESCIGCAACAEACPNEAITVADGMAHVDGDTCIDCGICIEECPVGAIVCPE